MDQPFHLGDWYVEPNRHRVCRGDESARLQPKMLAVLLALAEREGQTVDKNELLDLVWPRQYVYEEVLKRVILKLRKVLGDDSRNPRYIETIHKKGYRLLCPVRVDENTEMLPEQAWPGGSPFRSLSHFDVNDSTIFFGRSAAITEGLAALEEQRQRGRGFLLISGASGAGKSSLARAGLIPTLMRERGLSTEDIAVIKPADLLAPPPGSLPARQLAVLESKGDNSPEPLASPPVLLIDQFEEALLLKECDEVMDSVHQLARSGLVDVLVTLREDFLPALNEWPAIARLKQGAGTLTLGAPSQSELAEILQGPANVAGFRYEISDEKGSLKRAILAETGQVRQALPLLQFLLHLMYEARESGLMTWSSHDRLGGLMGAISQHADAVMDRLDDAVAGALPDLLERLTQFDLEYQRVSRRSACLSEIATDPNRQVLAEALVNERLLVSNTPREGEARVSLVHESLLQHWPTAKTWVDSNLDRLAALRRVQIAHTNWQRAEQSPDLLLRAGKSLADGQSVAALPHLDAGIRKYVERSGKRVARRGNLRRAAVVALAVLTLVSASATYLANQQRAAAEQNLSLANRAADFVIGLFNTTQPNTGAESLTARDMLDEGVRRIPVEFAEDPTNRARLLHATGRLYLQMGETERAEELLALALQDVPTGSRERFEYAWTLAELRVERNHQVADEETDRLLKVALDSLEQSGGGPEEMARAYWRAASLTQPEWRYSPYYWEQAHDLYTSQALANSPAAPEMLTQFAVVLAYWRKEPVKLQDTDRSLTIFEQALDLFRSQDRSSDPKYLKALENAAALQYSIGSTLKGIEYQRQAALGSRDTLGRLHIATPFRWLTLGDYLLGEGFYDEAEAALREAAAMYLDSYGTETPKWFETSLSLAEAWFHIGRHEEATLLLDALAAKQEQVWRASDHPETWRLWQLRGHLARSGGELATAEVDYLRALQLIKRIAAQGDLVRQRINVELEALIAAGATEFTGFTRSYLDKDGSWPTPKSQSYRRDSLRPNTEMLLALVQAGCGHPYFSRAAEHLIDHVRLSWENQTWHQHAAQNALAACGYLQLSESELQANAASIAKLTHPTTFMAIEAARRHAQSVALSSDSSNP